MNHFVWSQLRFRQSRAVALGLAVLVTAVSFTLLTAAASTSALRVEGTVGEHFKPAYDVLVRPSGSFTQLEHERGLVPANYLSGIFGGITFTQYDTIKQIQGVEVAAPVANVGYVLPNVGFDLAIGPYLNSDPVQLLRVRTVFSAHGGRSGYEGEENYVYVTRSNPFKADDFGYGSEIVPGRAEPLKVCGGVAFGGVGLGFYADAKSKQPTPFWHNGPSNISCYSTLTPEARIRTDPGPGFWSGATIWFPLLLGAVDPAAENALVGLDRTVVSGRPLRSDDAARTFPDCLGCGPELPVIASSRTYVDSALVFEIERLEIPRTANVPAILESDEARRFVTSLRGRIVGRESVSTDVMYERLLDQESEIVGGGKANRLAVGQYWTVSAVKYRQEAQRRLSAVTARNGREKWRSPLFDFYGGYFPAPPGSEDTQFRELGNHPPIPTQQSPGGVTTSLHLVGRFDPERLPGFSPLSEVPLESYYPPEVFPVDAASRTALGEKPLRPSLNLGDYVAQPPFLLTTLDAVRAMVDRQFYEGANEAAPISAIRIRVAGATGPDEVSQERIRLVAETIQRETGLAVDVTAGSSPRQIAIELPAGKFGRPKLLVREGWVKKGVAVAIGDAVDRKSLGLFGLVLGVSAFFLANGSLAAVRARRAEIGTLMTLGWPQRTVFAAILGELALVGVVAGALGCALAAGVVWAFRLDFSLLRVMLVVPVALLLTLLAGLLPALLAARTVPLDAIRPAIAAGGRARRVRGLVALAAVNLFRVPARTLVACGGLFVGVGALTVLLAIQRAFEGATVGTLLGNAIAIQVRTADLAAAGLVILLAAAAVADVLYRNLRERAAEFATLRTSGWKDSQLATVVALEALGLGLLGSTAGALAATVLGATTLGIPAQPLLLAALIAAAGGTLAALAASLAPLTQLARLTPTTVLAAE